MQKMLELITQALFALIVWIAVFRKPLPDRFELEPGTALFAFSLCIAVAAIAFHLWNTALNALGKDMMRARLGIYPILWALMVGGVISFFTLG